MEKHLHARIDTLTQKIRRLERELAQGQQLEASLRASERHYRSIFRDSPIGLAEITGDGRFLEVNQSFCNIAGYSRAELLGHTDLDIIHPDDRQRYAQLREQLLAGERPSLACEKRYVRKSGAAVWVNMNLSMTPTGEGELHYLLVAAENISERKTLQESLGRIATNLAKAEVTPLSGKWTWDSETGSVTASDEIFDLFGLPPTMKPLPGEIFLNRIHPEDRPFVEATLRAAAAERKPYHLECRLILPDGAEKLISASGEVFNRNEIAGSRTQIGVVQDITLRRQAEQALRESEQRFRELFEKAVDGILIASPDGIYIDANQSACHLLGYRRNEIIGKTIGNMVRDDERDRFFREKAILTEDLEHVHVGEWELRHKSGAWLPFEIRARMMPDGRWMAIIRDISERKRTQHELERYAGEVQDLYDNAPCGYHSLDRNGTLVRINKTELAWLGYSKEELVGRKNVAELMTEKSRETFRKEFPVFLKTGRLHDIELEFVRKNGTVLPVMLSASAVVDEHGDVVQSRSTLFDMRELAEAQKKLRQAATVFAHTNDAIIIADGDGTIVAVNEAFTKITGYRAEEVIGKNPSLLKSERQDRDFYRNLWDSIEKNGNWKGEIWDRRKSGEVFPVWQNITAVKDDSGKITDYISIFSDITTIKQTQEKLTDLAYHDPLTGLPNRLLFNDRMEQALAHARRHQLRAALLLLDLDRFKLINDTLGHAAGDQLLQAIGARLKALLRGDDTIARLGGDEFAIILAQIDDAADAALLARKIGEAVAQPAHINGQALIISTSIGIGIYPDDAEDQETLAKCADAALYGAKDKGKNGYEFYTREMTQTASNLLAIDRGLRVAIEDKEFVLHYQPQIDLSNGRIVGVEALIRWDSPTRGFQSPIEFIHVAEETGLIDAIGDWVLDAACAQLRAWRLAGAPPVRMAINLSPRQIRNERFVDKVRRTLLACDPRDCAGIDLEITESALQTGAHTVAALKELKSFGINIVIDDFGTGYSCLNSLKHLPIDVLKIDRSFIHGIPGDADDKAIATTIIAMAHSLGMRVIAEGVETQEQLRFVTDQHCDEVQGFLFFQPMSAHECERALMAELRGPAIQATQAREQRPPL